MGVSPETPGSVHGLAALMGMGFGDQRCLRPQISVTTAQQTGDLEGAVWGGVSGGHFSPAMPLAQNQHGSHVVTSDGPTGS